MANVKKIGTTTIVSPDKFKISHFNLTKANRTADGTMVMELIAKKEKFSFTYYYLTGTDLAQLVTLLFGDDLFFDLTYTRNDIEYTKTVYVGEIKYEEGITQTGQEVWKNIDFNLIEQ